ncbi:MAG TPA: NAD(P)/FAD-dependent oxidoreductase [Gemmatimonadaceae bacterium]|nr:NAD(P)/FAD-dependent oxidoreductase [Gemmatimonadaceae bacterium]
MPADAEVLVVGGGPAGAATAFFLARAGCDVLVVDRARFPRDKPCSEYLSPQASRLLQEMGALEALEQGDVAHLTGMRIVAPDGGEAVGTFAGSHGYRGFRDRGLAVRRTILDARLLERARAAGARVTEGARVRDLERDRTGRATGALTHFSDGTARVLRAGLVIGADGLRSVVARRAGLGRLGRWPRRFALVTHFAGADGPHEVGEMHVFGDGYIGIAPVGRDLSNVALVMPAGGDHGIGGDPAGFLARRLARAPRVARRLTSAHRVSPVRAAGPFHWHARRARAPGVALVGDAADFFDPFTGEGIYAALRGGEILAPYAFEAARARDPRRADIALDAYDRCRRHEFRGKWAVERAIGMVLAAPAVMNAATRGLAARPDLADLLVGVTGDFVPPREVLAPGYILSLLSTAVHTSRLTPPLPRHASSL